MVRPAIALALCTIAISGCTANTSPDTPATQKSRAETPAQSEALTSLKKAVDDLECPNGKPTPKFSAAWKRVQMAQSAEEIEFLVSRLDDTRRTEVLESLEMEDGSDVVYHIGDALLLNLRLRFARTDMYFEDWNEPPFLRTRAALREWAKSCKFDLDEMMRQYRIEAPKYRR